MLLDCWCCSNRATEKSKIESGNEWQSERAVGWSHRILFRFLASMWGGNERGKDRIHCTKKNKENKKKWWNANSVNVSKLVDFVFTSFLLLLDAFLQKKNKKRLIRIAFYHFRSWMRFFFMVFFLNILFGQMAERILKHIWNYYYFFFFVLFLFIYFFFLCFFLSLFLVSFYLI